MAPLCRIPIRELNRRVRVGELSLQSVVQDAIQHRQQFEPLLSAYHQCHDDGLLNAARAFDSLDVKPSGRLVGIPLSLKSVFGIDGYECFAGAAKALPPAWSRQGPVVTHLKQQGAMITGTTHAAELSVGGLGVNAHWGTPRNPWDAQHHRVPGGSSSGAAISVWEGSCAFALGTDTGGSVRVPASLAGLVGFKTSDGRWPTSGVMPLASRFDTIGVMALRVNDILQVVQTLDALQSDDVQPQASAHMTLSDFTVRRASGNCWEQLDSGIAEAIEQALDELCGCGMQLAADDGNLFRDAAAKRDEGPNTAAVELRRLLMTDCPDLLPHLSHHVAEFLDSATTISDQAYRTRVDSFVVWREHVKNRMADNEIIVMPTVRSTPPTLTQIENREEYVHYSDFLLHNTVLPSLNGSCAITLPVGLDAAGMPVGLQFVGKAGAEYQLLHLAELVEQQIGSMLDRIGLPPLCVDNTQLRL